MQELSEKVNDKTNRTTVTKDCRMQRGISMRKSLQSKKRPSKILKGLGFSLFIGDPKNLGILKDSHQKA